MTSISTSLPSSASISSGEWPSIVLGGGCFWCLDAVYRRLRGVVAVESGYCNGTSRADGSALRPHVTYEQVCTGHTGYVEVVKVSYDPLQVSLEQLLEVFFVIHDPTQLNRQGNDVGTQYRSGIYYQDATQLQVAHDMLLSLKQQPQYQPAQGGREVVTELLPLAHYQAAEGYHQDYFTQHPNQGYCAFVVAPKVQKFLHTFQALTASA